MDSNPSAPHHAQLPYDALIIDMDGVLWQAEEPLPGLHAFFALLRQHALPFVLATNNASKTVAQFQAKLARLGVPCTPQEILTSAEAAATWLATQIPPGSPVFAIGEDGLRDALRAHGFVLTPDVPNETPPPPAVAVLVGWDRALTWEKLRQACLLIRHGARFIGTNPDRTYPTPAGLVPGNGATLAALEAATGQAPVIIGKPEPLLYTQALQRLGTAPARTAALGDRLDTDILGAVRAGLPGLLVLSGVTRPTDLPHPTITPAAVYADLADLVRAWTEPHA